jgi:hypothetical protein
MSDEGMLWPVFVSNLLISVISHVVWSAIPHLCNSRLWEQRATHDVPVLRSVMLDIPRSFFLWEFWVKLSGF